MEVTCEGGWGADKDPLERNMSIAQTRMAGTPTPSWKKWRVPREVFRREGETYRTMGGWGAPPSWAIMRARLSELEVSAGQVYWNLPASRGMGSRGVAKLGSEAPPGGGC